MRWLVWFWILVWPMAGFAEMGSLLGGASSKGAIDPSQTTNLHQGSLFSGNEKGSMFAPYPAQRTEAPKLVTAISNAAALPLAPVERIRHVIGQAESPRAGYDAVQHGARIKPSKLPTQMTVGEIMEWISDTPGQPHAIGRYQFIPTTLRRVVAKIGARRGDLFSPALQDKLADVLLEDAGYSRFMAGQLSQRKFMDNLAAIWAGLPTSNGKSKYHGYAGNRATVTLAYFQSAIAKISPG